MPFYCKHGHDQLASLCAMCEEEITGAVTPASQPVEPVVIDPELELPMFLRRDRPECWLNHVPEREVILISQTKEAETANEKPIHPILRQTTFRKLHPLTPHDIEVITKLVEFHNAEVRAVRDAKFAEFKSHYQYDSVTKRTRKKDH